MEKASPRQRRHLDFISQFTTDLQHISGANNVVADALSRIDQIVMHEAIDYNAIAEAQLTDQELAKLITDNGTTLKFDKYPTQFNSAKTLYCDISTGKPRPYIPSQFRTQVFTTYHNLAHPGVKASVKLLIDHVVWPSIKKDVRSLAQSCVSCQRSKISRHTSSATGSYEATSKRFAEVYVDIIGPLPISEGNRYCVTMIDRFTRWAEAIAVPDITASTVASTLYAAWIARFGVPVFIVTDQGAQFESQLFRELSNLLGFERKRTTAYNPKCNGMIERWHRSLKAVIVCYNRADWTAVLPSVLLGLRTTYRDELRATSAELVYGDTLRIPGQFLEHNECTVPQSEYVKSLKQHFKELEPVPATRHVTDKIFVSRQLGECTHVFIRTDALRKALQPPYTGPHAVINRSEKFYQIDR